MVASAYSRRPVHARVVRPRGPFGPLASFAARFALAMLVATVAARWLGLVSLDEITAPLVLAALAVAVGLALSALTMLDAWARGVRGAWLAIRALALSLLAAVPLALLAQLGLAREPMLDLTTDPLAPPAMVGVIADPDVPVSAVEGVTTRRYEATIERVGAAVLAAIEELGWPIDARPLAPEGTVEAEAVEAPPPGAADAPAVPTPRMRPLTESERAVRDATARADLEAIADARRVEEAVVAVGTRLVSPVLRVPTDVTIRLRDDGDSTAVDIRVRSAEGSHDLGETERRARAFLDALDTATGRAGVR